MANIVLHGKTMWRRCKLNDTKLFLRHRQCMLHGFARNSNRLTFPLLQPSLISISRPMRVRSQATNGCAAHVAGLGGATIENAWGPMILACWCCGCSRGPPRSRSKLTQLRAHTVMRTTREAVSYWHLPARTAALRGTRCRPRQGHPRGRGCHAVTGGGGRDDRSSGT